MRATILCLVAFIAVANAAKKDDIFENARVAEVTAKLEMRKMAAQQIANHVKVRPVIKKNYKVCELDSDCPGAEQCVNYAPKLSALKSKLGATSDQYGSIYQKVRAADKRCKNTSFPRMPIDTIEEKISFYGLLEKQKVIIEGIYASLNKSGLNLTIPSSFSNLDEVMTISARQYNEITGNVPTNGTAAPVVRASEVATAAAPGLDMNTFLLISLLDKDSGSSSLSKLLPIMLMSQGGAGMGGDLLSNPLLLMTLLDDDKSGSSDLLLIMTLMNSGGLGGSTDLLSSPLLLLTLLKDNSSMTNLLPILLMGSMGASGMGAGAGINGILPLILLLDGNSTGTSDLLLIMLASGGALGGAGDATGGDLQSLLPILLLGDGLGGGDSTKDLLLFSLLGSGGLGGTGGAAGGLGGILPLLLLTNSSILNGSDSLLMILLLSGGLGGATGGAGALDMNMLLPLILKDSLNDTKDLLLIMMMGGMGGAGGAGALGNMLPLLLLGNGTLDTTTLVLVMMMSQAQPGTVTPID